MESWSEMPNRDVMRAWSKMPNRKVMREESYYAYCCAWVAASPELTVALCDAEHEYAVSAGMVFG